MKKKLKDLRQKTIEELKSEVNQKKIDIAKEFAVINSSKKREFKTLRKIKLEIAQILTIIREKELGAKANEKLQSQDVSKKTKNSLDKE